MHPDQQQHGGGLSLPLLSSLLGVIVVAAIGLPLDYQFRQPRIYSQAMAGVPDFPPPAIDPPPGRGEGRLLLNRCELTGRQFLLYEPRRRSTLRSYPLVVWLGEQQPDEFSANHLARQWGPSADRDRYYVLMPELSGDIQADTEAVGLMVQHVRECWYIDPGPTMLAFEPGREPVGRAIWCCLQDGKVLPIRGPADVPEILASEALWPTLVQIAVRPVRREKLPIVVTLSPIVAARLGRLDSYRWDLAAFNQPPSRLKIRCLGAVSKPGSYPVSVEVTTKSGRTLRAETVVTVPSEMERSAKRQVQAP